MSFQGKIDLNIAQIDSVPLAGLILNLTDTCQASRWPYVVICWLLDHIASCSIWLSGCAFPSPTRKVMGRISLVGIEPGRRRAWICAGTELISFSGTGIIDILQAKLDEHRFYSSYITKSMINKKIINYYHHINIKNYTTLYW